MDDLISRQATIDAIHEDADWLAVQGSDWQEERMERDKSILMSLPSAQPERCEDCENFSKTRLLIPQPERKTGKWIYEGVRGRFPACRCSVCGNVENADWAMISGEVNYCPNCGARMEEQE